MQLKLEFICDRNVEHQIENGHLQLNRILNMLSAKILQKIYLYIL